MKWLKRPEIWFLLAVALVVAGGALLFNNAACRSLDERDWRWFARYNGWRITFDCLSATCGVGLLTSDLDKEYTALGRWGLTAVGVLGAALYLTAMWAAVRRLYAPSEPPDASAPPPEGGPPPTPVRYATVRPAPICLILFSFLGLLILGSLIGTGLERLIAGPADWTDAGGWNGSAWRAIAAVASIGWLPGNPPRSCHWIYVGLALFSGLGWGAWVLCWPRGRRHVDLRRWICGAVSYVVFLAVMAALVFALEAPHGTSGPKNDKATLTGQPAGTRYARSLVQTACAATAGMPTESLEARRVTEGTKVALATVMLVGPLGGAAGGGITWLLLSRSLAGGAAVFIRRNRPATAAATRGLLAGVGCLVGLVLLAVVFAFGLLVIEAYTADTYQGSSSFADAFLGAGSAVAGGNLSSGIVDAVCGRNLCSGIRQSVDLYQYGMVWLMAAMLVGRVLPLFVICQAASIRLSAPPADAA